MGDDYDKMDMEHRRFLAEQQETIERLVGRAARCAWNTSTLSFKW